jgi:hypothetical protein
MKKDKFPEGGVVNEKTIGGEEGPEAIIPLDKLPELLKPNPVADVIKNIAALSPTDRLVLYSRLDVIINHDRDKASQGIDGGTHLFEQAINSL